MKPGIGVGGVGMPADKVEYSAKGSIVPLETKIDEISSVCLEIKINAAETLEAIA